MAWIPNVRTVHNGEPVAASTDNGPISDLTNRTDWLKAQLSAMAAGNQLVMRDQAAQAGMDPGTAVYFNDTNSAYEPAVVSVDGTSLLAGPSTFWQGIVGTISGTVADIVIFGVFAQDPTDWNAVFEGGVFSEGDVYLSGVTPGFLTTDPTTTAVYIGHMKASGELTVRATDPNSFLDHVHYEREMVGDPAGTVVDPIFGGTQSVNTPNAALQGWLPANNTYFPGYVSGVQIPTGAYFGYNIQQTSETLLRQIFPMLPPENAQFSQGGVILNAEKIVANQYGIWWMDNTYGNAPWPVDYAADPVALPITVWTTRIVASQTVISLLLGVLLNDLAAGAIDTVAVSGIKTLSQDDLQVSSAVGDNASGYKGLVTLTNLGVTSLQVSRGIEATATGGDPVGGYKGLVNIRSNLDLPAQFLWDEYTASPADYMALLTTNGVSSGSTLRARGYRLGGNALDFIDWIISAGSDLPVGVDQQVVLTVKACVDTPTASPTSGDVRMQTYRLAVGDPVSTAQLVREDDLAFQLGLPGQVQVVTFGPESNLVLQQNEQLLVRFINSPGGTPLTVDTFRQISLTYALIPV